MIMEFIATVSTTDFRLFFCQQSTLDKYGTVCMGASKEEVMVCIHCILCIQESK